MDESECAHAPALVAKAYHEINVIDDAENLKGGSTLTSFSLPNSNCRKGASNVRETKEKIKER